MPATRAPADTDFRFALRVYWEDTDAGGVVFYANYLKFFERARTEWLRSLGFEQETLRVRDGALFIVSETAVNYLRPARLDDRLLVTVNATERRQASLVVTQECWCDDALLATGRIRIGCVDSATFRPRRMPQPLLEQLLERPA